MQKQEFTGYIKFTIDTPELVGGASKHHTYRIHGSDDIGQFDISRRYSDFVILKQNMGSRWPGIYIPSLPEKKFIGNNEADFLIVRRQGLQKFLHLVSDYKYLWYSDEFQLFIKSKSNEVDKFLANLGKTNNRQIAAKYRAKFPDIIQSSEQDKSFKQYDVKVAEFRVYLKNTTILLDKMAKVSEVMAESRKRFNEKYENLLAVVLPNYEDKCTTAYSDDIQNLPFLNSKANGLTEVQTSLAVAGRNNSLSIANQLIKQQMRQINNFQQILKIRQQFQMAKLKALAKNKDLQLEQTKINAGKESILNKIKNASREQQLQENRQALEKARQELKDAEQICKVVDTMLARDQIARFKDIRAKNYYQIVREMAKVEKQYLQIQEQFWTKISGGRLIQSFQMEKSEPESKVIKSGNIEIIHENQPKEEEQEEEKHETQQQKKEVKIQIENELQD